MKLELILVFTTLVTGLVWLVYALRHRGDTADEGRREPWYVEYARSFFPVLLVVLVLRSFVVEPFRIPSGSMLPTLEIGDFILVNKFSYGIRLPVVHYRLVDTGRPSRGDVAVFRFPGNPSEDYIKRVIGLPGDRIAYVNKQLAINGQPVAKVAQGDYEAAGRMNGLLVYEEEIGEHRFRTLIDPDRPGVEGETVVPPGHYFVMGDNRDHSNDSRYWGFVPEENLVGRAFVIWMSWDAEAGSVNFGRIGNRIE